MNITLSQEVLEKLQATVQPGEIILLDNEDGEGPFVDHAISCQLTVGFRFLILPSDYDRTKLGAYQLEVATPVGPFYLKKSSALFLDDENELIIEPNYQRIQLRSAGGIIDPNVTIEHK